MEHGIKRHQSPASSAMVDKSLGKFGQWRTGWRLVHTLGFFLYKGTLFSNDTGCQTSKSSIDIWPLNQISGWEILTPSVLGYFWLCLAKTSLSARWDFSIFRPKRMQPIANHSKSRLGCPRQKPPAWREEAGPLAAAEAAARCGPWLFASWLVCEVPTFSLASSRPCQTPRLGRSLSQATSTQSKEHQSASNLALGAPGISDDATKLVVYNTAIRGGWFCKNIHVKWIYSLWFDFSRPMIQYDKHSDGTSCDVDLDLWVYLRPKGRGRKLVKGNVDT